jgi:hypothetical protein
VGARAACLMRGTSAQRGLVRHSPLRLRLSRSKNSGRNVPTPPSWNESLPPHNKIDEPNLTARHQGLTLIAQRGATQQGGEGLEMGASISAWER